MRKNSPRAGLRIAVAGLAVVLTAAVAKATEQASCEASSDSAESCSCSCAEPTGAERLTVEAEEAELDTDKRRLGLTGKVLVCRTPYRLTADRIELIQTEQGVQATGPIDVSSCTCESPPVSLRVQRAELETDGDLQLDDVTVRAGGIPVLWTPWLLLRPRSQPGVLPASMGWRGEEGAFFGTGVHLPVQAVELDWRFTGYSRGGGRSDLSLGTASSHTSLEWDYLHGHSLSLDARGAQPSSPSSSMAWDVDAIRGQRGLRATPELWRAAQPFDRARLGLLGGGSRFIHGVTVSVDEIRGQDVEAPRNAGVAVQLGFSSVLGAGARYESRLGMVSRSVDSQSVQYVFHETRLQWAGALGPTLVEAGVQARGDWASTSLNQRLQLRQSAEARWSLPLRRTYAGTRGAPSDPALNHWLQPFVMGRVERALIHTGPGGQQAQLRAAMPEGLRGGAAAVGVLNAVGKGDAALSAEFAAALAAPETSPRLWGGYGRIIADVGTFRLSNESAWLPERQSVLNLSRVSLNLASGWVMNASLEGQRGQEAGQAQQLWSTEAREISWPWFSASTWTGEVGLVVPWSARLASRMGTLVDVSRSRSLAHYAGLGYRHPCGCLAVAATASERIGRDGFDAWLSLDILPR